MATLPNPTQVARNHNVVYEGFYQQVDPAGTGCIAAMAAANFLKQSGLSDGTLSKIWDMSDPSGKGFLDKKGFFVALKLIALSQNGIDLIMVNLTADVPAPKMTILSGRSSPAIDWSIKPSERTKYEDMFYSMSPVNGKLPGDKVRPVMLNSKLPVDSLGKIWDLSDTDQDGFLSKEEFILAMHLIYKALENTPVPSVLPPELLALLVRKKHSISGGVPVLPDVLPTVVDAGTLGRIRRSSTPSSDLLGGAQKSWIVNAVDKAKYDDIFHKLDTDMDGYVTGTDIKDTFLQSGLPQSVLALIWNLCDIKQNGKLNPEQFALAMYFVQQKLQGLQLPTVLFPEHIPPTLRPKPVADLISDGPAVMMEAETTGNKELDLISSEIKELQMERMALEKDLAQKDADVKIKNGELKNSQNELEALDTMLKQLEMQKGEARKRLNDLDNQKSSIECELSEVVEKLKDELEQIEMLKKQKEQQKSNLEVQEEELKSRRQELMETKQEEERLESLISSSKTNLDKLTNKLQSTQLHISQLKLRMDQLNEQYRYMTDALSKIDPALSSGEYNGIPDYLLNGVSPMHEIDVNTFVANVNEGASNEINGSGGVGDFQEDPFKNKDPFKEMNGFSSDPFAGEDPFTSSDPFRSNSITASEDPFASSDPFQNSFSSSQTKSDPFQESDPFSSFPAAASKPATGFDPFGLASNPNPPSPVKELSGVDPFGADPFGPQAPRRPSSPTPALPPKKSKAPPPRPAPPKIGGSSSKPAPTRAAPAPPVPPAPDPFKVAEAEAARSNQGITDAFSDASKKHDPFSSAENHDNFANFDNFADFDSLK